MPDYHNLGSILGINRRNLEFIQPNNPRAAFPMVDDKILTKKILAEADVPIPETLVVIDNLFGISPAIEKLSREDSFVAKPARGRAGGGVLLIERAEDGTLRTPSGRAVSSDELRRHLADILFGVYSFGRMGDSVLVERKIEPHEFLKNIYSKGIPDIRVITFRGIPLMSMLRIPTDRSDGKANLHQGAIGVGIDNRTGITGSGVYRGKIISAHPDTGQPLNNLPIPQWEEIQELSRIAAGTVPLGYLGIDFVLDHSQGPLVLEMNARPGLQIQVINQIGLLEILQGIHR